MFKSAVTILVLSFVAIKLYSRYVSITIDQPEGEYDFIIVGGGTTGSVIAARLSEVDSFRILVLEAGAEEGYDPRLHIPLLLPLSFAASHEWHYESHSGTKFSNLKENHVEELWRGKVLGGTSNLNFQLYQRGSQQDYDSWADDGATGWNYGQIKKYFMKSEKSVHKYDIDDGYHGMEGPLHVGHSSKMPLTDVFLNATQELGMKILDSNGESNMGASIAQTTVEKGLRQSSVKSYLRPAAKLKNDQLHIVTDAHVTKVLFRGQDNGRHKAIGVQYVKNGKKLTVRAEREVILSAGVYGTPHILLLSGVGPKDHLEEKGIPVIQDLPGVGSNLQDHPFIQMSFYSNKLSSDDVRSVKDIIFSLPGYLAEGTGPLANAGSAFATVALGGSESQDKSERQRVFQNVMIPFPNDVMAYKLLRSTGSCKEGMFDEAYKLAHEERGGILFSFFMFTSIMNPRSRGIVRLNTSDPFQYPFISHRMFTDPKDMDDAVEGIKWTMNLMKTKAFQNLDPEFIDLYGDCAKTKEQGLDEYYKCIIRAETQLYHGCCTAKMGSRRDNFAVVDPQLRVYGIDGLRVADASVMPTIVSAPLQATCYMIGEKAADLIKETWLMTK